jgi:hypothetical protein
MPLPKEMGLCIRMLRREKPDMSSDQRIAICLDNQKKDETKKGGK